MRDVYIEGMNAVFDLFCNICACTYINPLVYRLLNSEPQTSRRSHERIKRCMCYPLTTRIGNWSMDGRDKMASRNRP